MEYNFDKEMDTLLRQAARSGQVVSTADFDSHPDADEISMFAENALPEKARNRAVKHLAECNNCRSILSNLILLNEETELETVSSVEEKTVKIAAVPWYKKLFVFPQIAYAMGALALVFSGVVGFLIYQTANQTGSFEMAKSSPAVAENKSVSGPNAGDGEPEFDENLSNSMAANTIIDTNSATNADSDIAQKANSNISAPIARIPSAEKSDLNERQTKEEISPSEKRPETPVDRKDIEKNLAGDVSSTDDSTMRESAPPPPSATVPRPPISTRSNNSISESKKKSDKMQEEQTKPAGNIETRKQIGGKTFNRVNGVWIDSAYNQTTLGNLALPPTTTVKRGSSQYKNLDKNIRVIAESLEGPVIIVANNKAYRIQ